MQDAIDAERMLPTKAKRNRGKKSWIGLLDVQLNLPQSGHVGTSLCLSPGFECHLDVLVGLYADIIVFVEVFELHLTGAKADGGTSLKLCVYPVFQALVANVRGHDEDHGASSSAAMNLDLELSWNGNISIRRRRLR
jgi:hypothetical protein